MNKKFRNVLIAVAVIIALLSCIFMFSISPVFDRTGSSSSINREMPTADGITEELAKGVVVEQSFKNTTDNIKEIAVVFSRLYFLDEDDKEVPVKIELLDGNSILAETSVASNDIPDQHRVYISIAEPITGYVGKELTLKVYENIGSDTGVALMRCGDAPNSSYRFGNKKMAGTICFSIIGE